MDYRAFEQRLLETIFTTEIPITPATMAYLYKISIEQAGDFLQKAAISGILNIESDDQGNLLYIYPNRIRLTPKSNPPPVQVQENKYQETYKGSLYPPLVQFDESLRTLRSVPTSSNEFIEEEMVEEEQNLENQKKEEMTPCPFCHELILIGSKKCRFCHEYLDYSLREIYGRNRLKTSYPVLYQKPSTDITQPATTTTQAALLSFFMPGLGQMCNGQIAAGVLWMLFTCLGYVCFIIPGIVLHVLCVINASKQPQLQG